MRYRLVVKNAAGQTIGELDRFKDLQFTRVLNREGMCSFMIPIDDEKSVNAFIQLGLTQVQVYRDDQIVWGGYMETYDGDLTETATHMRIVCKGYFNLLKYRYTWRVSIHEDKDAGQILVDEIETSTALTYGSLPITIGTIQPSINRDRTLEYKQLYELAVDLSEVKRGFDFEVTQTGELNVYYPYKGADKTLTQIFTLGKNIQKIRYISTVDNMCNQAIVLGSYIGDAMATSVREDTTLQSSYGLWQKLISYKDVETQTLLDDRGDDELFQYGAPRREYDLTQAQSSDPDWINLEVGDYITLSASKGFVHIQDTVRIKDISVYVTDGGSETVTYTFTYA